MSLVLTATADAVHGFFDLFVNRRAHALQSVRPNRKGRHYYTRQPLPLTANTIRRHLEGQITVGLYAVNPATQRCKWTAVDADYKTALDDLVKLQHYLKEDGISGALEMSRRGGHIWIFLDTPQPARDCRVYLYNLALRLGIPVQGFRAG